MDQKERLVNNLVTTKVMVEVVILVNTIHAHGHMKTQMPLATFLKVNMRLMKMSAREITEGREDDCMETSSTTYLALLSTYRFARNSKYSTSSPR